jgi:hypothetical protein
LGKTSGFQPLDASRSAALVVAQGLRPVPARTTTRNEAQQDGTRENTNAEPPSFAGAAMVQKMAIIQTAATISDRSEQSIRTGLE